LEVFIPSKWRVSGFDLKKSGARISYRNELVVAVFPSGRSVRLCEIGISSFALLVEGDLILLKQEGVFVRKVEVAAP